MQLFFAAAGALAAPYIPALAAIGGVFGVSAAGVGWTVGSLLGSWFLGSRQHGLVEGPRMADLKLQAATYGSAIGIGFGTFQKAGVAIWGQDVEEHVTETTSEAGKGIGGATVTSRTYSYTVSFAVAIHDGPIVGVRRIKKNGEAIYDVGATASIAELIASNAAAEGIRIYLGTETQLPDPLIEADKGAGLVPAFRGTAYIVFEAMQTQQNTIPNIETEIVVGGSQAFALKVQQNFITPLLHAYGGGLGDAFYTNYTASTACRSAFISRPSAAFGTNVLRDGMVERIYADGPYGVPWTSINWWRQLYTPEGGYFIEPLAYQPQGTGTTYTTIPNYVSSDERACLFTDQGNAAPEKTVYIDFNRQLRVDCPNFAQLSGAGTTSSFNSFTQRSGLCLADICVKNAAAIEAGYANGDIRVFEFATDAPQVWTERYHWQVGALTFAAGFEPASAVLLSENYWWLVIQYKKTGDPNITEEVRRFPRGSGTPTTTWTAGGGSTTNLLAGNAGYRSLSGWQVTDEDGSIFWIHCYATGEVREFSNGTVATIGSGLAMGSAPEMMTVFGPNFAVINNDAAGSPIYVEWWGRALTPGAAPTAGSIVQALGTRTGLTASDWDVSQLTDPCDGYIVPTRMSPRAAIEPLMAAFYFDVIERDHKIVCVKRGGASVATILAAELGARAENGEAVEPVLHTREAGADLPDTVDVLYLDLDADYAQGHQQEQRRNSASSGQLTIELPIVMTGAKARHVAEVLVYSAELALDKYVFSLTKRWAELDPADPILLPVGVNNIDARITQVDEGANGVLQCLAEREDLDLYTGTPAPAAIPVGSSVVELAGLTRAEYLDIPLLRDQDDWVGFYFAACGYLTAWRGTQLYISEDGGASWTEVANSTILSAAALGTTESILANAPARPHLFDYTASVDVALFTDATLAGATRDQLFGNANFCVIGNEVLQFATATLLSARKYRLAGGMLRCRLGTEWAGSGHALGERFLLLEAGKLRRPRLAAADLNSALNYKPVTLNSTLQGTPMQSFTCTGVGSKPLAPVNLGGGKNAAGDWLLKCVPQTRYDATLADSVGGPLGEASEAYEVDVMDGSVVKRVLSGLATAAATYTAAQQTTDWGGVQSTLSVKWYQLSAAVGRGFVANATLPN